MLRLTIVFLSPPVRAVRDLSRRSFRRPLSSVIDLMALAIAGDDEDLAPDKLSVYEQWWVRHMPFLEEAGYRFRPRYQPGWEASWKASNGYFEDFEDGQMQPVSLHAFCLTIS